MKHLKKLTLAVAAATMLVAPAFGQSVQGVSDTEILIGSNNDLRWSCFKIRATGV